MNVSQLQPPQPPQLQRYSKSGSEKDADFLALKLLNRRTRLRLSPQPLPLDDLPQRARLFAVANIKRWFAAIVRASDGSYALSLSPLSELRSTLTNTTSHDGPLALNPNTTIPLKAGTPHILAITRDDSRILVAFTDGSICVYDWSNPTPLFTFSSPASAPVRDLFPSTGDSEIVAVLRIPGDGITVELLDVHNMLSKGGWSAGGSPQTNPTSVSWSPKGKQIAIGLESGDIITFSPSDTSLVKSGVSRPPSIDGQSLISLQWISNTEFHGVYAPAGPLTPDSEQTHYILTLETKNNLVGDIKLNRPYLPFPGIRPPGSFIVTLKNWDPSRILLLCGDSTSSDIGLIGSLSGTSSPSDSWYNFTLEEDSSPSVPLDADLNETVLLGLDLDVTTSETFNYTGVSGETTDVPPPPIMYLYASDGTLQGWHVIQTQGVAYPDMATPVSSTTPVAVTPTVQHTSFGASQPSLTTSPTPTATTAFGSISPQHAAAASSSGGFSAYSGTPSAFGNTSFSLNQQSQQPAQALSPLQAPVVTRSVSVEMASATDDAVASESDSGFGSLSLGEGVSSGGFSSSGTNSMFGSFGNITQQSSTSAFSAGSSGSGFTRLEPGFGAFGNTTQSSSSFFQKPGAAPTSPFQSSSFGSMTTTPTSTFAQPGASKFGASSFGAPSFGAPSLAAPSFGAPSLAAPSFGASSFGAPSSFGGTVPSSGVFGNSAINTTSTPNNGSSTNAAAKNAFSAFSGSTSSFGAFASASSGKSFSDLLRQKDAENKTDSAPTPTPTPSSSFFQKSAAAPPSAFQSSSFGTTTTPAPSTPTPSGGSKFGAPSFSASVFESPPTPGTPTNMAANSAFSAFSGSGSSFGSIAPASAGKSFSDLLRQKDQETKASSDNKEETTGGAFGGGAFGGLKTSTTGFSRLQPGFGAFGNTTPSSSPFFQTPGGSSLPSTSAFSTSAFSAAATTPPSTNTLSGTPKFGAPSFGSTSFGTPTTSTGFFGKPAASTSSPATPATPETPTTAAAKSAFSAFSGGSSPFGALASGSSGKSFSDLLRQKEGEDKAESERKVEKKPAGFSRTAEEWKKPVSVFAQLKEAAAENTKDADDDAEGDADGGANASFRYQDDDSDEGEDILDDFLRSDEEYVPEEEEDEEEDLPGEEEVEEGAEPATISRSPSASPTVKPPATKPQSIFNITFSPASPSKPEKDAEPSKPTFVRARSTTPPGSPAQVSGSSASTAEGGKLSAVSMNRAASVPPMPVSGKSLLGLGRPSTRPAKSSPLANRPISGDDDHDEDEEPPQSPLGAKKARVTPPAPPSAAGETSRPKTPPVLFGNTVAPPKPAPFMLTSAISAPSNATKATEGQLATPSKTPPSVAAGGGIFSKQPLATPAPQGGIFSTKPVVPSATPVAPSATLPAPSPLFGSKPSVPTPGSVFSSTFKKPASPTPTPAPTPPAFSAGSPAPQSSKLATGWPPAPAAPVVGPAPIPVPVSPAQVMVIEFLNLHAALTKELNDLQALAAQASQRTIQLQRPSGSSKTEADLKQPTKWVMSDLMQFKNIMKEVERGLETWEKEKDGCISQLRELEGGLLKGSTRKEEIERFSKASKDTEYARMLKQRVLSPDHLETQAQLRRSVRNIRNRIQQLEEYVHDSKKKLNSLKNGRPSLKPPSLDTIHRTYRNIDAAIDQEEDELANLAKRLSRLELSGTTLTSLRDRRLPDRSAQRAGREVTPNIAASTAAALNAERSAQKLKRALLSARKEPLLNTKAVDAVPPERDSKASKALLESGSGLSAGAAFSAGLNGGIVPSASAPQYTASPGWSLPPFTLDASPTAGLGAGRTRGPREKQHAKPIHLNQSARPALLPPPAGFSWGPVTIQPKSTISIFASVSSSTGTAKDEKGLSDSWVSDGFGK